MAYEIQEIWNEINEYLKAFQLFTWKKYSLLYKHKRTVEESIASPVTRQSNPNFKHTKVNYSAHLVDGIQSGIHPVDIMGEHIHGDIPWVYYASSDNGIVVRTVQKCLADHRELSVVYPVKVPGKG